MKHPHTKHGRVSGKLRCCCLVCCRAHKGAGGSEADGGSEVGAHWPIWRHRQLPSRPTRSAFITFMLAAMSHCDGLMLALLAQARPLMDGLLHHMVGGCM